MQADRYSYADGASNHLHLQLKAIVTELDRHAAESRQNIAVVDPVKVHSGVSGRGRGDLAQSHYAWMQNADKSPAYGGASTGVIGDGDGSMNRRFDFTHSIIGQDWIVFEL